ncbi:uncharacterized protein C05D11.1-like [Ornithodoros turicata]|uniref:uncharacterized protein C05D11.1-like n=1 Tax=Ornithodoros turicata TaxID=34597 RepID=UPI003139032F
MENFKRVCDVTTDANLHLVKYKSSRTGITVFTAKYGGPLVTGHLCFATEAQDDDGLPHTLEHLVFMGSEDYPYKGVLDQIANRCLASGTNAWTDIDHTCYTMTTAGAQGFLKLLPIYMDHVLYPILTEAAYITEVHHINGEGENAGVVFCEMQARENTADSRCMLHLLRVMFPEGCGYHYETGGLLKQLRGSTTNKKVRTYHRAFYRPENLCIVVTGNVTATELFTAIEPMELKIIRKGSRTPFIRPWQDTVPPLAAGVDMVVKYPSDIVGHGVVYVAFRGPMVQNLQDIAALIILQDYLTSSSVSPLRKYLVEAKDPLCTAITARFIESSRTCFYFIFENAEKSRLFHVKDIMMKIVTGLASDHSHLNMERIAAVIQKRKLRILNQMETIPHETIASNIIGDFLYGHTVADLKKRMCQVPIFMSLLSRDEKFWTCLLEKYIINNSVVCVLGVPSPALLSRLAKKDGQRTQYQREFLQENGLKRKATQLEKAIAAHKKTPPKELLQSVKIPSLSCISYHYIRRSCSDTNPSVFRDFDLRDMPYRFELDHVDSSFVSLAVIMDSSNLPRELRLYLPLFLELLLQSAVSTKSGSVSHDVVAQRIEADLLHIATTLGFENGHRFFCGSHSHCATLSLLLDMDKYCTAVQWINDLLTGVIFDTNRIVVVANKMLRDAVKRKKIGPKIVSTMIRVLCFPPNSNQSTSSILQQQFFLQSVLKDLSVNPHKVVSDLEALRCTLVSPEKITIHMSANVYRLAKMGDVKAPWKSCLITENRRTTIRKEEVQCNSPLLGDDRRYPRGVITAVGSVDTAFLMLCTPSITSYAGPDLPPLLVAIQYLVQLEGPLWRKIRGQGLAYAVDMFLKPCDGLLYFVVSRATLVASSYKEAMNIVELHTNGRQVWDDIMLESSKSSLIFEEIKKGKSINDVVLQSILAYRRNVNMDYTRTLVKKISLVKLEDVIRVSKTYLPQLFDPLKSKLAICCHPAKVEETVARFAEMSRHLTIVSSPEDERLLANLK